MRLPLLQHGAHGPVEDEDTLLQNFGERLVALLGCGHNRCALKSLAREPKTRPAMYPGDMRYWVVAVALVAVIPACADTRFRVRQMTRDDVPMGRGQCDIRLQVDNEVEVSVSRDMVNIRTISGQNARDDGSECNVPLPDREVAGFKFENVESRGEVRLVEEPSPRNGFAAIVHIRDSAGGFGLYRFRLTWETGPCGQRNAPG